MAAGIRFGTSLISQRVIFLQTNSSYAFTNIKPVVPGHVLVACTRCVARLHDLSREEVADLFQCVHLISPVVQKCFNATSLTIAVQDGKDAGQTVEHVHVHILPRKPGDFDRNDDIYDKLEKHDKAPGAVRPVEEMASEAQMLRELLDNKINN